MLSNAADLDSMEGVPGRLLLDRIEVSSSYPAHVDAPFDVL
jgi:hypothetical protein